MSEDAAVAWEPEVAFTPGSVHRLFEQQAARTPDRTAVTLGDRSLSYGELDRRANQLAGLLGGRGAGAGTVVGIRLARGLEMAVALLGVLKSGAAYLALDPRESLGRWRGLAGPEGERLLITHPDLAAASAEDWSGQLISLDSRWRALRGLADSPTEVETAPEHLALVSRTSGSTGAARAVLHEHSGLPNACHWQSRLSLGRGVVRTLLFMPLSVSTATTEIFSTWMGGGTLLLIPEARRQDLRWVVAAAGAQRADRLLLPAVGLGELVALGTSPQPLAGLRELVVTGGALAVTPVLRAFCAGLSRCTLQRRYGTTESRTIAAHEQACWAPTWEPNPALRPITNRRIVLLEGGAEVARGATGVLHVTGPGLARGYWDRPELTASAFPRIPMSGGAIERSFCTGDLARVRSDGGIELLGRSDRQLKVRGFRVQPAELEAELRGLTGVRDAAVVAPSGAGGGGGLVAYVTPAGRAHLDPVGLRRQLRDRMPPELVPATIVRLEELPRTPSGKVDRARLAAPPAEGPVAPAPPATAGQRELTEVWASLLGTEAIIAADDDFFDLGGDSLLAARMVVELEGRGLRLPLESVFAGPATISRLAAEISAPGLSGGVGPRLISVRSTGRQAPLFVLLPHAPMVPSLQGLLVGLGPERPVHAVLPAGGGFRFDVRRGISGEALAELELIRSWQPGGPYLLCGYSFSGLLAYQLAGQLSREGEAVAFLGLIDAVPPASRLRLRQRELSGRFPLVPEWLIPPPVVGVALTMNLWWSRWRRRRAVQAGAFDLAGAMVLARRHRPAALDCPLTVLASSGTVERVGSASLDWERLHGGPIDAEVIPGGHLEMFDPDRVGALARALAERLERAAAGP